jgi:hypothetical protein
MVPTNQHTPAHQAAAAAPAERERPAATPIPLRIVHRAESNDRLVMVPESQWREVLATLEELKRVRHGCTMYRRLTDPD